MSYRGPRITTGYVVKRRLSFGVCHGEDRFIYPVGAFHCADRTVWRRKKDVEYDKGEAKNGAEWRIVRLFRRVRGERGRGGPQT